MNFEKWMKKRGNNKLNAYAKNPYHVSWIKRMPMWSKVLVPTALAMTAAVVVISVGVLPHLGMNKAASKSRYSDAEYSSYTPPSNGVSTQAESKQTPGSQSDSASSKPLLYENISYTFSGKNLIKSKNSESIGSRIGTATIENSNNQSKEVEIYSFHNIDQEIAILAKEANSNLYNIYFNYSCHFHDVDDFVNLLSPDVEIKIDKILYCDETLQPNTKSTYIYYDEANIYNIRFDYGTIEGYTAIDYDYESSYKYYYIGLKVPAFDGYTFTAYFYDSGYIIFNFLKQNHIFELGQERYQAFTTYLTNTAQHH
jgi:hypothetical protein